MNRGEIRARRRTGSPQQNAVKVVGGRENNLDGVTLEIPRGPDHGVHRGSGSGKSSLVFDTVAAESQRRLDETFSAFVRTVKTTSPPSRAPWSTSASTTPPWGSP